MGNKQHAANKEEVLLRARLDALKSEIAQYEDIMEDVKRWRSDKTQMESELETLRQKVDQYGDAADIVAQKESILSEAAEEKAKADEEKSKLEEEIASKQAELEPLKALLGDYKSAEEIVEAGRAKAKEIEDEKEKQWTKTIDDAEKEAKDTVAGARTEAERIKGEAEKALTDANAEAEAIKSAAKTSAQETIASATEEKNKLLADRDTILQDARDAAGIITSEAQAKVQQYYDCKEAEGQARKNQIISSAEEERDTILATAKADAESIAESIKKAADKYSEMKRAEADSDYDSNHATAEADASKILSTAKQRAAVLLQEADNEKTSAQNEAQAIRDAAVKEAEKVKEDAFESIQAERDAIQKKMDELALQEQDLEDKLKKVARAEETLKRREKNLDAEVAELVEAQCDKNESRFQTLQGVVRMLRGENERLNKENEDKNKWKVLAADTNELLQLRELVKEFRQKGVTEDTIDEFVSAGEDLKKALETIQTLKEDLRKANRALLEARDNSDELSSEKDMNKYYKDVVRSLTDEAAKNKKVTREEMVAPIKLTPGFMASKSLPDDEDIANESEWLDHIYDKIGSKSEHSDLKFSRRQIYAYHTAQKIRDMSPLVVLAGVSGTGKSELPKNYAIHGGMNFLSIPVKPDWDSPASLFGYYNSIERRFEATELVQALYQMSNDDQYKKQMMMVLLDEMNLAHPEQYFADMLSKLETSRGLTQCAQYDIVLGGGEHPEHLDIGSNILWTGTMNEDETTKGLSDKVIDRSTLITFPRPTILYNRENKREIKQEFILSREKWDSWCKATNNTDEVRKQLEKYREVVQQLNENMSAMGRNLGHRVWQSMSQYICHHPDVIYAKNPDELDVAMKKAFCDSIAFKVMPKLRGVEVRGQNEEKFEQIGNILATKAEELIPDYNHARELTTELFQWCSADFMNKDDE